MWPDGQTDCLVSQGGMSDSGAGSREEDGAHFA